MYEKLSYSDATQNIINQSIKKKQRKNKRGVRAKRAARAARILAHYFSVFQKNNANNEKQHREPAESLILNTFSSTLFIPNKLQKRVDFLLLPRENSRKIRALLTEGRARLLFLSHASDVPLISQAL